MKPSRHSDEFTQPLLAWFNVYGRKNLPWQKNKTAYTVWISEIMLQQTQVKTAIPYYNQFIECFPNVLQLAQASLDEVLALWSGLGYYSRARNIHKTAQIVSHQLSGQFPQTTEQLEMLPGIGPSTAAAIVSLVYNQPAAILDGNVKRVLSRYFMVAGDPSKASVKNQLLGLAEACMCDSRCADYTQAIMDLGATCCTPKHPNCQTCPLSTTCGAYLHQNIEAFPQKKPKAIKPTKEAYFLVLTREDGKILIEKRPPNGIWGGLWCLPLVDKSTNTSLEYFMCESMTIQKKSLQWLFHLKHTFTHFHLNLDIYQGEINGMRKESKRENKLWVDIITVLQMGIPKPVRYVLEELNLKKTS